MIRRLRRATPAVLRGLLFSLLAIGVLASIAPPASADTRLFTLYDFAFENGSALPDIHLAYDTSGNLSAGRDNAILLVPGATASRHVFDPLIGPGKLFDTDRYFVISMDPLGGGESSSPADGLGQEFPRYGVRDMMEAAQILITRELAIPRLRAVVGMPMGSFVALELGIHHPESVGGLVLMAPAPKADPAFRLIIDLISSVVALDPEWQGGHYSHNPVDGLRHAGMLFYPWLLSEAYLNRVGQRDIAREVEASAAAYAAWDANALMLRLAAYRAHDVASPYQNDVKAALARVAAPTLILACDSDRLIGSEGARAIRDNVAHATYAEISSDLGHHAFRAPTGTPEGDFKAERIREFLGRLASGVGN